MEQRAGRIVRQGNKNEEVHIFRYVTENTFDAYLYQILENKQRFISQIMTSKSPVRSAEDIDETALSYAEVKALATGNPHIKEKMDLDIQVSKLKLLKANHLSQQYTLVDAVLQRFPKEIRLLEERISGFEKDASCLEQYSKVSESGTSDDTQNKFTGVVAYRDAGCDFLIAIGGGSPLDSAKAIAAMTVQPGAISDYMGKEIEGEFPPMVLIPTTAGTGSEATKFSIITDTARDVKMLLKGDALLPDLAVVDPAFTLTSPQLVTVATGMDALTHAIEAYTSRRANPFTDALALDAITRIFRSLPVAFKDGGNYKAREDLAIAAYHAGLCINNASVTLVHGMSRPIGALFHVPHGVSNAMILRPCLGFAMEGCPERFAAMARDIGAAEGSGSANDGAVAFLTALDNLCNQVEIPSLAQHGIDRGRFLALIDKMATDAMMSGSPGNTIREVTKDDLVGIYQSLW